LQKLSFGKSHPIGCDSRTTGKASATNPNGAHVETSVAPASLVKRIIMKAKIIVMPKKTVLDPQGKTVQHALESLGFKGIQEVRIGKFIEVELKAGNQATLKKKLDEACSKLLSNPVIEDYEFSIK